MCFRVLQRNRTATLEAEKSQGLLSASWRLRKAGGVIQFKSEGLFSRGASDVIPVQGQKMR